MANNFKNVKLDLSTNSVTTLYTAPSATTAVFKSLLVSNDQSSGSTITVTITDSANTTEELLTEALVVMEGEILKVTAADADRLHVIGSFLEIT